MSKGTTPFNFGSVTLPEDVENRARGVCASLKLTPTELFVKWEAWALTHRNGDDIPTLADLDQLATSIREKAEAKQITPRSASKRRSHNPSATSTPLYTPVQVPTSINIDDFFNYVPDGGDTNHKSRDDEKRAPSSFHDGDHDDEMHHNKQLDSDDGVGKYVGSANDNDDITPSPSVKKTRNSASATIKSEAIAKKLNLDDDIKLPGDDVRDGVYTQRAGSGRVEATHGSIDENIAPPQSSSSTTIPSDQHHERVSSGAVRWKVLKQVANDARYMNDDLRGRVETMRRRVEQCGRGILRRLADRRGLEEIPECAAHAFFVASTDVTFALGRIRVELDEADGVGSGRINEESVQLESTDGARVKLDLSRLAADKRPVFLAPGAVVVVEGVNVNGRCIDVHAIHDNCVDFVSSDAKPRSIKVKKENDELIKKEGGKIVKEEQGVVDLKIEKEEDKMVEDEPLAQNEESDRTERGVHAGGSKFIKILTASGPFTTAANLQYEPLDDFLDVVCKERPDIAVLSGPFVDARHKMVKAPLPATFNALFEQRVIGKIVRASRQLGGSCQFFLVPALEDIHHDFVAPQPAFRSPSPFFPPTDANIHFISNPCVLELSDGDRSNDVTRLALTSLPAVVDIADDCICWNVDRFHAISAHLVRQRSFYPTAPPSRNVPLDSTLMHSLTLPMFSDAPGVDCILSPSRLKAFVCAVDEDVVVVNPGFVCRGVGGGTYAEVTLPLHNKNSHRPRNLNVDRAQVSVIRL